MYSLYTDGSSYPGRRHAGWAYHLQSEDLTSAITESGTCPTNDVNNGELLAVVCGLERLGPASSVTVYTDSLFVIDSQQRSMNKYKWQTPLMIRFHRLLQLHHVGFVQVLRSNRPIQHSLVHHLAREAARGDVQNHDPGLEYRNRPVSVFRAGSPIRTQQSDPGRRDDACIG
jgi:ribonuclease HI